MLSLLSFPKSEPVDVIAQAFRSRLWRIGQLSILRYRLHPDHYHPGKPLQIRFRVHLQYGPHCFELALPLIGGTW